MTEKELVKGCKKNDRLCQKELYDRYSAAMYAICLRYARHELEAQDILQEGFIRVFEKIDTYRGEGTIGSWIKTIIIRTAIKNFHSGHYKHEDLGLEVQDEKQLQSQAISSLDEEDILDAINKLPDGYRTVFNLYAIEGYKHKEIAEMLDIGESTSRSQLVKAKRLLRKYLAHFQSTMI